MVINPKYQHLQAFVEQIPERFELEGEIIYDRRNQIRVFTLPDGQQINVKRYGKPSSIKRLIYSTIRNPKAERAYKYALRLLQKGIATPEPIAYILEKQNGLLTYSYLVTVQSPLKHTFYEFRDGNIAGKEELIKAFAHWTAHMHENGVLHKDFSPGNILYDNINGTWQFELVDINRMHWGKISAKTGCRNFCRLWGKNDFFEVLADAYAEARHIEPTQAKEWILAARALYWKDRFHEHFVTENDFTIGVIVSTYNNPRWLELTLWALCKQAHKADEILVADDGSDERTKAVVASFADKLPIKHIWHEDNGFRKTTILNKAVLASQADYLIFIDQDLIAREDFISQHYRHARKGCFISGGAILMPETLSNKITPDDISYDKLFNISWLKQHGMPWKWKMSKLWRNATLCAIMNRLTTAKASWNGGNASTWREYIIQANGFDTRMRYGAEDREFGQRLLNAGYKGIQLRYGTPLMHLYHTRPYRNEADWQSNRQIWNETIKSKRTQTEYGMRQLQ